jgi:exopolysaccharide production protein ExoQ
MQTAVTHQKNLPWLNLIFLSLLFFTSSRFDLFYSVNGPPVITGLASNRSGDALKAVSILLLCLWSFHSLWRHRNYSVRLQPLRAILIGSYCVWCGLSFLWTDDRGLTGSRLFLLAATMFIAFALAFRFSNREIVFLVFVFGAASNFVGLCAEICLGTFRPWNAQYRFSGLWHPNTHGLALSLLVLAGLALWRSERDHKTWIGFVTAFGFVLLLLTRSRTSVGSTIFVAALTTAIRNQSLP